MQIKIESFVRFWKEKKPFQTIKTSVQTTPEICIFANGLVFGFCQKTYFFPSFVFSKMDKKKRFVKVLKEKKLFKNIKTSVQKKPSKFAFFKWVSPCFFFKKWRFFHRLFLCKMDKEKVFSEVLEKKSFFQTIKTSAQKTRQICLFLKGLVHDVWQKMNEKPNQPMKKKVSAVRLY